MTMMCETHPGHAWGSCPGGRECPGPGMPWVIRGRDAIEILLGEAFCRGREDAASVDLKDCEAKIGRLTADRVIANIRRSEAEAREKMLAELLREWQGTPFFETREQWARWMEDFAPRVGAAVNEHDRALAPESAEEEDHA